MASHSKKKDGSDQVTANHTQTPVPIDSHTMTSTISEVAAPAYVPLTQFLLFPNLAPELCLKIFHHALPLTTIGHRMLRVSGEYSTKKPRIKNKGYIKFTLLNNIHSTLVKDIGLLSACTTSREVFISRFHHYLHAGNGGKIRYADEDIIYIVNMPWLVNNTPIMKPSRSHLLKARLGHQCPVHLLPYHVSTKADDQYVPILWLLRNLKVVGAVEWDFDALDKSIVDWLLGWAKNVGSGAVKKMIQKQLEALLSCVQLGWVKAMKEGRKRPALKIITVNGD
ncbi:hypothetical protein V8E51_002383 [Hyaloscypha variabilis]